MKWVKMITVPLRIAGFALGFVFGFVSKAMKKKDGKTLQAKVSLSITQHEKAGLAGASPTVDASAPLLHCSESTRNPTSDSGCVFLGNVTVSFDKPETNRMQRPIKYLACIKVSAN